MFAKSSVKIQPLILPGDILYSRSSHSEILFRIPDTGSFVFERSKSGDHELEYLTLRLPKSDIDQFEALGVFDLDNEHEFLDLHRPKLPKSLFHQAWECLNGRWNNKNTIKVFSELLIGVFDNLPMLQKLTLLERILDNPPETECVRRYYLDRAEGTLYLVDRKNGEPRLYRLNQRKALKMKIASDEFIPVNSKSGKFRGQEFDELQLNEFGRTYLLSPHVDSSEPCGSQEFRFLLRNLTVEDWNVFSRWIVAKRTPNNHNKTNKRRGRLLESVLSDNVAMKTRRCSRDQLITGEPEYYDRTQSRLRRRCSPLEVEERQTAGRFRVRRFRRNSELLSEIGEEENKLRKLRGPALSELTGEECDLGPLRKLRRQALFEMTDKELEQDSLQSIRDLLEVDTLEENRSIRHPRRDLEVADSLEDKEQDYRSIHVQEENSTTNCANAPSSPENRASSSPGRIKNPKLRRHDRPTNSRKAPPAKNRGRACKQKKTREITNSEYRKNRPRVKHAYKPQPKKSPITILLVMLIAASLCYAFFELLSF